MRFLDRRRVRSNMRLAADHLLGPEALATGNLKDAFIAAMNAVQSTTIKTAESDLVIDFDNPALVDVLVKRGVFSAQEIADGAHLVPPDRQEELTANIRAAERLVSRADPNLLDLVVTLIGSVAVYRIPGRDGGTVSCCIGMIWESPSDDWTVDYYAEMLVHEFAHNSVFLEDMVNGVLPNPALLEHEDALTISVIRRTKRAYDKSFHSACIASVIMYLYHRLGHDSVAEAYLAPMRQTIHELHERDELMRRKDLELLTDNGRAMVRELQQFIGGPDYSLISKALARC